MTNRCNVCRRDGLLFVRDLDDGGYVVCVCSCVRGKWWKTKGQLRAYIATLEPQPEAFGRIEEFFTAAEIANMKPHEREHTLREGKECIPQVHEDAQVRAAVPDRMETHKPSRAR